MSSESRSPSPAPLDAAGRVVGDASCVGCGYNLRTLKFDAVCPECAHPVAHSIRGYFLRHAPSVWVKGLARGLLLFLIAVGAMVVLGPLVSVLLSPPVILALPPASNVPSVTLVRTVAGANFAFYALVTGLAIVGLIYLTRPDPALGSRPEGFTARRMVRLCCFLLPIPVVADLLLSLAMPPLPTFTPGATPLPLSGVLSPAFTTFIALSFAVVVVTIVVYALTPLVMLRHLEALLRRIPRPGLVRFARIEFWGLLASTVVLTISLVLISAAVLPTLPALMAAAATVSASPVTMPASGPASASATLPAASGVSSETRDSDRQVVTTRIAATLPARLPFPRPGLGVLAGIIIGGGGGTCGGCGTAGFTIAGVVLLIMACTALFTAAREAEKNAAASAEAGPPTDACASSAR